MKVLFVNNRDSFVWNLVDAFSVLGVETVVVPNTLEMEEVRNIKPDTIVISPGPGIPERSEDIGNCLQIIKEYGPNTPILGVCLGHQAINRAYGGSTGRCANGPVHGKASSIIHNDSLLFAGFANPFEGGRYHSLEIKKLAPPLESIAHTEDGSIMAIKHKEHPVYGIQFHPESVLMSDGLKIIENFLALVIQED
ncbi:MAG: anthranilate synthase component II [Methanohalophilus sp. T328-1]|uniref:anthranilate synthase component II n=1 Tax=Methanohalophilus sp. DAL1 TaxID=1864608 RepID=UPI00079C849F|nr:aminodeoxychorismate/anthranilate synthase component II [Methanohalophilus sp. DAL1]KXS46186.1 MAG: anthranilate synthase component II [Methanohalophilus sp. T328-1]OBZ35321.1 MAG: anthranilate synthase component II [Methanohalophilus sp. DAL1]